MNIQGGGNESAENKLTLGEIAREERREKAIRLFGRPLGVTLMNYAEGTPQTIEEQNAQRRNFARELILALEGSTRVGRVKAVEALLMAVEKNAPTAWVTALASGEIKPIVPHH